MSGCRVANSSLVPHDRHDLLAVGFATNLSRPELSDQLEVFFIVEVHLALLVVLELWVINHLLWDLLASEAPDTLNVTVGDIIDDAHSRETMLSEVVESL